MSYVRATELELCPKIPFIFLGLAEKYTIYRPHSDESFNRTVWYILVNILCVYSAFPIYDKSKSNVQNSYWSCHLNAYLHQPH